MIVLRFQSAAAFLDAAQDTLMASEAENHLILGIAQGLSRNVTNPATAYLATVSSGAKTVVCAAHIAPFKLVLTRAPSDCISMLANDVHEIIPHLTGVFGPAQSARAFAAAWSELTGGPATLERRLQIQEARAIAVSRPVRDTGRLRAAVPGDQETLTAWTTAFVAEADIQDPVDAFRIVAEGIARGRLHVWDTGEPVSMAAWAGRTRNGVRINFVYTPREHRRNGYASACVSALSRDQLEQGRTFCWLYTKPSIAVERNLFSTIGYRPVSEVEEYRF